MVEELATHLEIESNVIPHSPGVGPHVRRFSCAARNKILEYRTIFGICGLVFVCPTSFRLVESLIGFVPVLLSTKILKIPLEPPRKFSSILHINPKRSFLISSESNDEVSKTRLKSSPRQ